LRCDRSNISRLVDRAARHDLVRRRGSDEDSRVTMIELSPQGRRLAEAFIARLKFRKHDVVATWTDERRRAAARILNELAEAVEATEKVQPAPQRGTRTQNAGL
jgi:DNA-binding MarR family transcriptional regulator